MPVRIGFEATRFGLRVADRAVHIPFDLLKHVLGEDHESEAVEVPVVFEPEAAPEPEPTPEPAFEAVFEAEPEPETEPEAEAEPEAVPQTKGLSDLGDGDSEPAAPLAAVPPLPPEPEPPTLEPEEPAHIEVETEVVGEFAEAGAEEGAGPEIHVDEPWPAYKRMRVADIQERVAVASTAELTVVQLYETSNRNRRSILDAVDRRMKQLANEANATNGRR